MTVNGFPFGKIAIRIESLRQPLRKAVLTAAQLGARGVTAAASGDLAPDRLSETGRRELRRMIEGMELAFAALVFPAQRGFTDPEAFEPRLEQMRQTLVLAYQLRCPWVCCPLGALDDLTDQQRDTLRQVLAELAHFGDHNGAALALRTAGLSPTEVRKVLEAPELGGVGVSYDPAAIVIAGGDPVAGVRTLGSWIRHVHARDAVRGMGADPAQEVALGQGQVDWPDFLAALGEFEYRSFLTVERTQGDDPRGDVGRGVQFLKNIVYS